MAGLSANIAFLAMTRSPSPSPETIDWSGGGTNVPNGGDWGGVILAAVALVAIVGVLIYLSRVVSGRNLSGGRASRMKVVERLALGRDSYMAIVQVGERLLLVGVSRDHVELVSELDPDAVYDTPSAGNDGQEQQGSFFKRFVGNLKVVSGIAPAPKAAAPAREDTAESADFKSLYYENRSRISGDAAPQGAKDPTPEAEQALGSGKLSLSGDKPEGARTPPKADYNAAIESLKRYVDPDGGAKRAEGAVYHRQEAPRAAPPEPAAELPAPEITKTEEQAAGKPENPMDGIMHSVEKRRDKYSAKNRKKR